MAGQSIGSSIFSNEQDSGNTNLSTLAAGQTWTGTWKDLSGFAQIITNFKSDQNGTFSMYFSSDGITTDRTIGPYTLVANTDSPQPLAPIRRFYKCSYTNSSVSTANLRIETRLAINSGMFQTRVSDTVSSLNSAVLGRNVIFGRHYNNSYSNVPVDSSGHLEVAVHSPRLPFGSMHVESLTPLFQFDAVYRLNSTQVLPTVSGSGSTTVSNSMFVISSGNTIYSQAVLQSRKRLRYRPGQGSVARFAGLFTTGVASSYQVMGVGHPEDGFYFGYKNTLFGILYINRGVREVQTLTVATGASSSNNCTITLNSVANVVALTNASNIYRTAYEISAYSYAGWTTELEGATVKFIASSSGNKAGTFSFSAGSTGASASFAETTAGATETETFIPQSSWNGDVMDGTGNSGIVLDPTKGNVYEIDIQYLGFGAVTFYIEVSIAGNNSDFVPVHTLLLPNTLTATSIGNPSLPFTAAVYSAGSTSDLVIKIGSFGGFIEGKKVLHGPRFTYESSSIAVTTLLRPLFTILNARIFSGRANQSVINLLSVGWAYKHNQPGRVVLIKNGTLSGNPNFSHYDDDSCSHYDNSATGITYTTNSQVIFSVPLGETDQNIFSFEDEITLQPGEILTACAITNSATATAVRISINTREDQ